MLICIMENKTYFIIKMSTKLVEIPIDYLYTLNFNQLYRLKQVDQYYNKYINDNTLKNIVRYRNPEIIIPKNTALSAILTHFYKIFYKIFTFNYPYNTLPKWIKYEDFKNEMVTNLIHTFISELVILLIRDGSFKNVGHYIEISSADIHFPLVSSDVTILETESAHNFNDIIMSTYFLSYIKQPIILDILQSDNINKLSNISTILTDLLLV